MHRSVSPVPGAWEHSTRWQGWTLVRQALPRRYRHLPAWRRRSSGHGWRLRWRERSWPASSWCSGSPSSSGLSARSRAAQARPSWAWRRQRTPRTSDDTPGPEPAVGPSLATEPSGTPIPSFIPLPSLAPNEQPPDPPNAPSLSLNSVGAHSISIRWTPSAGGGEVQKWEIWRRTGFGSWFKLGEVFPAQLSLTNTGLASGTYLLVPGARGEHRVARPVFERDLGDDLGSRRRRPRRLRHLPHARRRRRQRHHPPPAPMARTTTRRVHGSRRSRVRPAADDDELPVHSHACNNGARRRWRRLHRFERSWLRRRSVRDSELPVDLHQCNDGIDNDGDLRPTSQRIPDAPTPSTTTNRAMTG